MKKYFSLMVAFAAMFAFAACTPSNEEGEEPSTPTALAKPVLTVENVTSTSFEVKWEAVENAVSYMVNNGSENKTVTETSFKMEKLNAGTYTVKVMALAAENSNYTNSEFASIQQAVTGLTPDECDWVECSVSLPTEEDAASGYFPFLHIFHSFKGTGIVEIKSGCFTAANYENTPAATLAAECDALDADTVALANGDGVTTVFQGVQSETEYRLIAVVTNEDGLTVIFDHKITTAETQPHPSMENWVGLWEVTTEQAFVIPAAEDEPIYLTDQTNTVGVEIVPALDYAYNAVAIYGLSVADPEGTPALGLVGTAEDGSDVLQLVNWLSVGAAQDGSYYMIWNSWSDVTLSDGTTGYYLVSGEYPAFTVNNGVGYPYEGSLDGGGTFKVLAWDIYAYDASGSLLGWFYEEGVDIYLNAGTQTWTRVEAVPSAQSMRAPVNFNVNSVVLPSLVAM